MIKFMLSGRNTEDIDKNKIKINNYIIIDRLETINCNISLTSTRTLVVNLGEKPESIKLY